MALELNESNFDAEVLKFNGPALIDFWAPWCGPCKAMGPVVDALAKEYVGKVKIAKVNVDENPNLAAKYGVQSIPFFGFFVAGQLKHSQVGGVGQKALAALIEQHLLGK